jgi:hypothetical protein
MRVCVCFDERPSTVNHCGNMKLLILLAYFEIHIKWATVLPEYVSELSRGSLLQFLKVLVH